MNPLLKQILENERKRQQETIDLIPSENFASKAVREVVGSVFMNKYAEGYAGARYYEGNENIDELETLAKEMILKVFGLDENDWHVNVQVLSGAIANLAIYTAILNRGDKILSMYLPDGGHLSHGWSYTPESERQKNEDGAMVYYGGKRVVSFTSSLYKIVQYKTDPNTQVFNYDFIEELALKENPRLIITGGTAYPRDIDYKRMGHIADKVGAMYLADVSHEAGLIAGKTLSSPFAYADFVMFTTQKTLRGPRGAVVVCKKEYAQILDRAVFPGLQGGPFEHNVAGLVQALSEVNTPEFKKYTDQVVKNCKALASELISYGFNLVSGGTDKHLLVVDLTNKKILGRHLARALAISGIITNKTTIPYEKKTPVNPSGVRMGTPFVTTRGMKEKEMKLIAGLIDEVTNEAKKFAELKLGEFEEEISENEVILNVRSKVVDLCTKFPLDD